MFAKIKGKLVKRTEEKIFVYLSGITYEILFPKALTAEFDKKINEVVDLVIYHYIHLDKNRGLPMLIGFLDELERDFFEMFISVSGIGPRVALKAMNKPISSIAAAIERADIGFLKGLGGLGQQKSKHIIAHLQGKVGRFALLSDEVEPLPREIVSKEIVDEAKQVLKRLQYSAKEIESMIKKATSNIEEINSVEELLNEIYRQRQ